MVTAVAARAAVNHPLQIGDDLDYWEHRLELSVEKTSEYRTRTVRRSFGLVAAKGCSKNASSRSRNGVESRASTIWLI
jgi:hypothetical protein